MALGLVKVKPDWRADPPEETIAKLQSEIQRLVDDLSASILLVRQNASDGVWEISYWAP
jgi:hypothetical protein